jgi:large subunit ribosomal protein L24
MKTDFSKNWLKSKNPDKQRKYVYNAPLHIRGNIMSSMLSKELKKKYQLNSLRIRKGDKVKIMRGQFKGKEGKVEKVDIKKYKVVIDKCEIIKKDGTKTFYPIHFSNLMIIELNLVDKKRISKLNKKKENMKTKENIQKKIDVKEKE